MKKKMRDQKLNKIINCMRKAFIFIPSGHDCFQSHNWFWQSYYSVSDSTDMVQVQTSIPQWLWQ